MIIAAVFGLVVLLTLALSFATRDAHIRSAATLLSVIWLLSGLADYASVGDGKFFPAMDGLACATYTLVWAREPKVWIFLLAVSFLAMTALHAAYFTRRDFGYTARYAYDFHLNIACAVQLVLVIVTALTTLWRRTTLREAWGG